MVKSDQLVIAIIIAIITVHTAVWVIGYFTHKLSYLFSFVNAIAAILLIGYWVINQLTIQQHIIEGREIAVLSFELLAAILSVYTIICHPVSSPFKIAQYIIFGIHFIVLIAALLFMLTFKINRLI
ncbi:MAG: hypothetical protein ABIP30_03545 [Ferruginibacter sp.]